MPLNWKQFEILTKKIQQDLAPNAQVTHDEKIVGRSGVKHQCDVVVRGNIGQYDFLIIMECKDWPNKKVGTEVIRDLKGKLIDISATKGVVVSSKGFTNDANILARSENINLYTLFDAENVQWSDQALIPIVDSVKYYV
jgi:hypothetical protein